VNALVPHSRPTVGPEEAQAVARVVRSGQLAQGGEVAAFEEEMAAFTGRRHAVAVSSGTAALHLALLALAVGEGNGVVVPSYVCTALVHAVWAAGAVPGAADIDPVTRNLDPEAARGRLSEETRAVVVPHLFGLPAAVEAFAELGVPLVEDCAMSIGASHRGRPVGSFGAVSVCSFYATKMLATGEGGMVLTDDEDLAAAVRARREYDDLPAAFLRFNYKMTDMAAAVGRVQLKRLPDFVARRREIAARYDRAFQDLSVESPLASPEHIYYRYVIRASFEAGDFIPALEQEGVAARRPVFRLLHRELGEGDEICPHAVAAHRQDVSLPLYPSLSDEEIDQIIGAVQKVSQRN